MSRVLALLAAVAMVAGALVVRDRIDGGQPGQALGAADRAAAVLCDEALGAVCRALGDDPGLSVTLEAAGESFDRLIGLPDGAAEGMPDAWVTLAPWPAMVDEARGRGGLQPVFDAAPDDPALGSSPLVLVAWDDRTDVLLAHCRQPALSWGCAASVAGQRWDELGGDVAWGPVKPGLDDPTRSSPGLAALAQATAEELGGTGFGSRRLADGAYQDWLGRLGRSVTDFRPATGSVLSEMLVTGRARYDLAATTEAAAGAALETERAVGLLAHYAEPLVTADVVAASRAGLDVEALRAAVEQALAEAGWHTATAGPAPLQGAEVDTGALPTSPAGATQPSPGAMTALRSTFTEVVR